jgi:transglutaminase-like putative cysteine protease
MKLKTGCALSYEVAEETVFIFNIEAARLPSHSGLDDRIAFTPAIEPRTHIALETKNRYVKVLVAPGPFSVRYTAALDLVVHRADPDTIGETPIPDLPLDILPYLLPSRFVPSDRLAAYALREFGELATGHTRISSICNWIYDSIDYQRGSSDAETTATEILVQRAGVCRDFAHLGIAFCRALGIPARYVSCYALGLTPPDFHAVFEAYLDGRWWLFDPTRQAALDGLVRIGVGRDAAEVAFATHYGRMKPASSEIWIERADGQPEERPRTTDAISTDEPASQSAPQ